MQGAARRRAADARVRPRQQITVQAALSNPARPTDANTHPETKPLALETAAAWLCQVRAGACSAWQSRRYWQALKADRRRARTFPPACGSIARAKSAGGAARTQGVRRAQCRRALRARPRRQIGRQIGEERAHFRLRAEVLRARKARAALRVRKAFAVRNADARFVRGRVVRRHKLHRLRGDERNLKLHGQMDGVLDIDRFFGLVGALHLDIETVREQARPALRALPRRLHIARGNGESDIALLRAR